MMRKSPREAALASEDVERPSTHEVVDGGSTSRNALVLTVCALLVPFITFIAGSTPIVFTAGTAAASARSTVLLLIHPTFYILGVWGMTAGPVWLKAALFRLCPRLVTRRCLTGSKEVRPLQVSTTWAAFRLGGLAERAAQLSWDPTAAVEALAEAGRICGTAGPLTVAELQAVGSMLQVLDSHKGVLARVRGLLKTVNILWVISIVGIGLTLLPALSFIVEPLAPLVAELSQFLLDVACLLWSWSMPIHELAVYYASFVMLAAATRCPKETAPYIALTGAVIGTMAWCHSSALHLPRHGGSPETYMVVTYLFHVLILAPMAVTLRSTLLGWLTVAASCGMMGFSVICGGLVTFIGFESKDALARCLIVTCVANVVFLAMVAVDRLPAWLEPFQTGVHTFAGPVHFLSLLIASSAYGPYSQYYLAWQLVMAAALLVQLIVGGIYSLPAAQNVAVVYTVLYLLEKSAEARWLWGEAAWLTLFVLSLCMWRISLFLKANPEYLMPLLSTNAFKARGPDYIMPLLSTDAFNAKEKVRGET